MAHVEFQAGNGHYPWVIFHKFGQIAFRTEAEALAYLPDVEYYEGDQWTTDQLRAFVDQAKAEVENIRSREMALPQPTKAGKSIMITNKGDVLLRIKR